MQGTLDIMAMMKRSSINKQNSAASNFSSKVEKNSFRDELTEARKTTALKEPDKKVAAEMNKEAVKENKVEKLAKVMSNSKATAEKAETTPAEATAKDAVTDGQTVTEEKASAETQEITDAAKIDSQTQVAAEEINADPEMELDEVIQSMQDLLQQITQLMSNSNAGETNTENTKQVEAAIQAVSEKLEQILTKASDIKLSDADVVLKDMKLELKELVKQLKTETKQVETVMAEKPNLQETVNTLKQLINKMNEIKPMLQTKLAKAVEMTQNVEQIPETQLKQSKIVNESNNSTSEAKPIVEETKLQAAPESNAKESTEKDNKDSDKESKYKANDMAGSKHAEAVDKHKFEGVKNFNIAQPNQSEAQINIKEINLNQQKQQVVTINKSDIVNQVIKKADIIVREGHSEMVMKLEPESLGKLNLKIVVERGLVTAKFIAESQQVKEVLESSFNQLKDALQEKGIAVQNFSVSVGQQTSDSSSNQSFNQWKQSLKIKNKAVGDFMGLDDEAVVNQNPYNYHEGKFDYRA